MAVADSEIEKRVLAFIRDTELPNRHNAIRDVTGAVDVLPSAVAKVITKLIEAGTIRHLKSNDRLEMVE
jgi:DNA-binding MarR family transcriptional regulator